MSHWSGSCHHRKSSWFPPFCSLQISHVHFRAPLPFSPLISLFFTLRLKNYSTMKNKTKLTEFILLGLTDVPEFQVAIFTFFFLTYFLSIIGNLTILILTLLDSHLQTPMYFFLRNFSFLEISFTNIFIPRVLFSITTGNKSISFAGCFTQYFFAIFLGSTEFYLLAAMSYDRYVAICKPLHYSTIMNLQRCTGIVVLSWTIYWLCASKKYPSTWLWLCSLSVAPGK